LTLPKVLGRALAVSGAGPGLTNRALGLILGEENHTLTVGEIASHYHDSNPHDHSWPNANYIVLIGNLSAPYHSVDQGSQFNVPDYGGYVNPNAVPTSALSLSTLSNGGGATHNNMQPSSFLNVMIKL
jgi:microcystin-dependent protein